MSFNTPTNARGGAGFDDDDDDPLFSSAIMDTTTRAARTPDRRALSLEPPSSRQSLHTPSNNNTTPAANLLRSSLRSSVYRATPGGLSASGRRSLAATPHARAAYRTIDQRRAAALTPGGKKRRESFRPRRESMQDVLRMLSRRTKHETQPIPSSSSSPSDAAGRATGAGLPIRTAADRSLAYDDDDDDELPIDRPRLSLPLDVEDDDDDLVPPRLSEMDENATIEFPRRAYIEQPSRLSMGSVRLSEYRNYGDLGDDDDDDGGGGFDPGFEDGALDGEGGREQDDSLDRIENDPARRETLASARESDFGFQVPVDADQSTFMMAVEAQSSPARPLPEMTDEQPSVEIALLPDANDNDNDNQNPPPFGSGDMGGGGFEDMGPYYDLRSSSPEDYAGAPPADATDLNAQEDEATEEEEEEGGDASAHRERREQLRPSKRGLKLSKYNIEYPSLPPAMVKRLAGTFARSSGVSRTKIDADALAAIQRASDWFFEQLGDDLAAYAKHAKRKTIDESDMLTLMRRQRQTNPTTTPFSLAQRHLPRELLQELRMPKPPPPVEPRKKKRRIANGGDGGEGEVT